MPYGNANCFTRSEKRENIWWYLSGISKLTLLIVGLKFKYYLAYSTMRKISFLFIYWYIYKIYFYVKGFQDMRWKSYPLRRKCFKSHYFFIVDLWGISFIKIQFPPYSSLFTEWFLNLSHIIFFSRHLSSTLSL